LQLQLQEKDFAVQDIFDVYFKVPEKQKTTYVIDYFEHYLKKYRKLIGIDLQEATWKKFRYTCNQAADFIWWKYRSKDLPMKDLKLQFLSDFEYYLKTERNQRQITVNKYIQRFRRPIRIAVAEGLLLRDPFALHRPGRVRKRIIFLTQEELSTLVNHSFKQTRLERVKNLFVFCCYTGLAYREMSNLKPVHIQKGFDGIKWIKMTREKTGKLVSVPLLPVAERIIEFYRSDSEFLLPRISNQKFNSYIKEIADILGIEKRITHHTARKTFASTVLLYNDVPMEVVSEILGHSSIKLTEAYYGKIVQKRVSKEMIRIAQKMGDFDC
jgi:integrase